MHGPTEADAVRVEGLVARAGAEDHDALVIAAAAEHAGVNNLFLDCLNVISLFCLDTTQPSERSAT